MIFDHHKNFAGSTVLTPPSPDVSGTTLTLITGGGALFPIVPFNAVVCPFGTIPTQANAEVVRVTAITGDTITIIRSQEGSPARAIVAGDQFVCTATVKTFTDIETQINANETNLSDLISSEAQPNGIATLDSSGKLPVAQLSVTGTSPISVTSGVVSIQIANTTNDGYLSHTDWNTFNNKQPALGYTAENVANKDTTITLGTSDTLYPSKNAVKSYVDTTATNLIGGAPVGLNTLKKIADAINDDATFSTTINTALAGKVATTRLINTTAPLSGGGALSTDLTLSIPVANTTTDGYLSHTDWNTFNNKQAALGYTPANKAGDTFTGPVTFTSTVTFSGLDVSFNSVTTPNLVIHATDGQDWGFATDLGAPDNDGLELASKNGGTYIFGSTGTAQFTKLILDSLSFANTAKAGLSVNSLSTSQRSAISGSTVAGSIIFNNSTLRLEVFDGSQWNSFARLTGDTFGGGLVVNPADNTRAFLVSTANVTGSNANSLVDLTTTWNTTGAPTVIRSNLINTASAPGSLLIDLQVAGISQFNVDPTGAGTFIKQVTVGGAINARTNVRDGLILLNSSPATNTNRTQESPNIRWQGAGWKTNSTAASQTLEFRAYLGGNSGASVARGYWELDYQVNGGGWVNRIEIGPDSFGGNIYYTTLDNNVFLRTPPTTNNCYFEAYGDLNIQANANGSNGVLHLSRSGSTIFYDASTNTFAAGAGFGGTVTCPALVSSSLNVNSGGNFSVNCPLWIQAAILDSTGNSLINGVSGAASFKSLTLASIPVNTSAISASGYSLTGTDASSLVTYAGTWNTSGTPTAIKLNITDTASNSASLLMDLQIAATSKFKISKSGDVTAASSFVSPLVSITSTNASGLVASNSLTGSNTQAVAALTATWNTTGNARGITLNVTNTASSPGSQLMTLTVGSTDVFFIDVDGSINTNADALITGRVIAGGGLEVDSGDVLISTGAGTGKVLRSDSIGRGTWQTLSDYLTVAGGTMTGTLALTPATDTSALTVSGYSVTGSGTTSMLDLAGTWNTTGAPTAIKLNITDTASDGPSKLIDLQVGGTSKFYVDKSGSILIKNAIQFETDPTFVSAKIVAAGSGGDPSTAALYFHISNSSGTLTPVAYLLSSGAFSLSSSLTGSSASPSINLSSTWNTTGTPTAIKLNITDTASNSASLLLDLQVNSSSVFSVDKTGSLHSSSASIDSLTCNTSLVIPVVAFAALPASPAAGAKFFINDSTVVLSSSSIGSSPSGGGSQFVPVYYTGSAWIIG